jgi:hypothetical protein
MKAIMKYFDKNKKPSFCDNFKEKQLYSEDIWKSVRNKSIAILCLLLPASYIYAQYQLSGTVKDKKDGGAIPYATVALMKTDSSVVTGTTTDASGRFILTNVKADEYLIRITYVGYGAHRQTVNVPAPDVQIVQETLGSQTDLGDILLAESENRLQEVVVTARRPFVEQQIDRYVVNVGSHLMTAGRNALDLLEVTPGVLVTGGKVTVMGNNASIYINGRPSNLSGKQLQDLLSSTQGETVDRIEVITNPPARYDASGGSVINIRMKKNIQHGINGSANAGYRQGRTDSETGGIIFNYQNQKMNLFGNYTLDRKTGWSKVNQINVMDMDGKAHTFDQHLINKASRANYGQQYRIGADFLLNDSHVIGMLLNGYHTGNSDKRLTGNNTITPAYDNVHVTTSDNRSSDNTDGKQANLNYQGTLSKSGRQINIDFDYGTFKNSDFQHSRNEYFDTSGNRIGDTEQLRHTNPPTIKMWSVKADYSHPLSKKGKMEFGFKSGRSQTDNNLLYEIWDGSGWETDLGYTNHFVYTEQIHAAYASFSYSFAKWGVQAGLRGEYTDSNGDQRTTGTVTDSTYLELFPSLNVNYRLSNMHQFSFNYGRRIYRPSYTQLNPFEIKLDAYSFTAGNPYLKPMIMNNLALSYINSSGIMTRLSYNIIDNVTDNIPVQENGRYGLRLENFNRKTTLGMMINYRKSLMKKWMLNLSVEGQYQHNTSNENYGNFENNGFALQAQLYNQITLTPTLSANLTAMYVSSQRQTYMVMNPMSNVSIGISKSFLKDKLSVSLTANDLFATYRMDMRAKNEEMDYHIKLQPDSRWVNIGVRYSFGSNKVKASRQRKSGIEDEAGRVKK